jgi:hypothetical protein
MIKKLRFETCTYYNLAMACHEASHACYAIAYTGDADIVEIATLAPDEARGSLAHVQYDLAKYEEWPEFHKAVSSLVGEASDEQLFGLDMTDVDTFDKDDAEEAAEMIDRGSPRAVLNRAKAKAVSFVLQYEAAIRAVGARLYQVYEMSGPEIKAVMDQYPPRPLTSDKSRSELNRRKIAS